MGLENNVEVVKSTGPKRGVYFLADDRLIDLSLAFLNSFRAFNPLLPLCLIPYNDNTGKLEKLGEEYDFTIFPNKELMNYCDEISLSFHPYKFGHYRKLAIWEGEFDEFIYIDIDTVVLSRLDFVFDLLREFDFITSSSNIPSALKWVWKDSVFQTGELNREQIYYAANTGFIASKKGALPQSDIREKQASASMLAEHMNLYCYEQPLLNYLMVTSGKKYSSLSILAKEKRYSGIKTEQWAGRKGGVVKKGRIRFKKSSNPVLFLHWAGEWQVYELEKRIISLLRSLGLKRQKEFPVTSYTMPYRKLWKHYRFLHQKKG